MKQINILTFHRAINYGAVLQCYALYTALLQMGYDVKVIDYNPKVMRKNRRLFAFSDIVSFLYSIKMLKSKLFAIRNFNNFLTTNLQIISIQNILSSSKNSDDIIIIGSDQLWSPRINSGFDKYFWGNFRHDLNKITYAVSMGTDHSLSREDMSLVKHYLTNFKAVSVREDSLKQELLKCGYTKNIQIVLDPTLLLNVSDYDKILEPVNDKDYIFYYEIRHDPSVKKFLYSLAKQLNCQIIALLGPKIKYSDVEYTRLSHGDVSPGRFIGLIKNAKCIVTSSFHGTSFSIIYRKDFYSLVHKDNDRALNLLNSLLLEDRMVNAANNIKFSPVNYDLANAKLIDLVNDSKKFLTENL